nr:putative disease resistance protein RGA3 isoform X2 [Setaria viridis]
MAAVLDAMIPYVKKLITDMAEEEVSMLLGVSDEITRLDDNMEGIKAFLADAERRRITDQSVQRWVRKLKDAMYDATDIIDLCELEADKRRGSTEDGSSVKKKVSAGCFQLLLFCMRNPVFAHKIGSRIKELNQRLDGIHKEADRFKFSINLGSNLKPRKLTDAERSMQKTTSEFNESAIVGEKIEQDTRELAQLLITGGLHDIKVVSIVGTGGMGKTTHAQKIFNEVTIQEHFKVKVWLSITQNFDEIELLKTAIEHAGGVHGGTQDKTLLTRTLTDTLSTGRFLLVMDDVWSDQAWSHVLSVPVKNASQKQQGNWVLITTRSEDLAQRMGASFYQHHVRPLNEEDAWSLLTKQLPPSPNQVVGTDYLRDVGMKIVRKCDGLPLAVKVMGGLLSTRSRSEREWEVLLDHHAWSVVGLPKELDSRIYLSYEDLSSQQKQCFLYCSLFPKGTFIRWRHVIPMWISEGFIQPHADRSSSDDDQLEQIAIEYCKELITRNLIEAQHHLTPYDCTMHDVVRSFAEFIAREELLVVQDMQVASGSNDSLVRRLSIGPTSLVSGLAALQKQSQGGKLVGIKPLDGGPPPAGWHQAIGCPS